MFYTSFLIMQGNCNIYLLGGWAGNWAQFKSNIVSATALIALPFNDIYVQNLIPNEFAFFLEAYLLLPAISQWLLCDWQRLWIYLAITHPSLIMLILLGHSGERAIAQWQSNCSTALCAEGLRCNSWHLLRLWERPLSEILERAAATQCRQNRAGWNIGPIYYKAGCYEEASKVCMTKAQSQKRAHVLRVLYCFFKHRVFSIFQSTTVRAKYLPLL